jgi:cytidyltransferase-like protein
MNYAEKYNHKIKRVDELADIIGAFPRHERVIMCHGTFDVVHPGHLRHLMFAKSKADILIVSLTCDAFIKKAELRPYVPEDLRAVNLSLLEMVDYVLIDNNETPIENIRLIKPDFFAKGYEYNASGINFKTNSEKETVEAYGGVIMFTPGDIVYSSSKLIENSQPNIRDDKLLAVMEADNITFDQLHQTLDRMNGIKVHVLGDIIVDGYTDTTMIGGQTKTPTMSVRYEGKRLFVGGAGIVAKHLKAAGADITFTSVSGDDDLHLFVKEDIVSDGINLNLIVDSTRPTTEKNAIICSDYRLLKIDTLDNRPVSPNIQIQISDYIKNTPTDCIVFSDFRHGIFNGTSISPFIEAISEGVYKVADSQVASRWGNITDFYGFDLITPNEREARFSLGDQDSVIRPLALRLLKQANCENLILKLGEKGLMAYRKTTEKKRELQSFFVIDSFADNVIDPVGAGDALLAYSCLGDFITGNSVISAILGSLAAACECECDGNIPITREVMHKKIERIENRVKYLEDC